MYYLNQENKRSREEAREANKESYKVIDPPLSIIRVEQNDATDHLKTPHRRFLLPAQTSNYLEMFIRLIKVDIRRNNILHFTVVGIEEVHNFTQKTQFL